MAVVVDQRAGGLGEHLATTGIRKVEHDLVRNRSLRCWQAATSMAVLAALGASRPRKRRMNPAMIPSARAPGAALG